MLYNPNNIFTENQRLEMVKFAQELSPLSSEDLLKVAAHIAAQLDADQVKELITTVYKESRMCKQAGPPSGGFGSALQAAGSAAMIVGALMPLMSHMSSVKHSEVVKSDLRNSYNAIKQRYPDLAENPLFDEEFTLIATFSPSVAAAPIPTANIIRQLHRLGPEAVTPQMLQQLVSIEASKISISDKPKSTPALISDLGSAMARSR